MRPTSLLDEASSGAPLTTLMPQLHSLIAHISSDYERKFQDSLDPYADVSLNQAWMAKWRYVFLSIFHVPSHDVHARTRGSQARTQLLGPVCPGDRHVADRGDPLLLYSDAHPAAGGAAGHHRGSRHRGHRTPTVASQIILGRVFNHVQILVMGGLTIGKAFARTNLEMYAASALHKWTAHRPALYLLGVMLGSCVLCAFVSNIAAPLLVLGVVQRTLWEFPEGTTAPHGILLGLAFSCNLGGMLSPIASPQNAVAMTALSFHNVSFSAWVAVALPVVLCCVLATWVIILVVWKPFKDVPYIPLQVVNAEADKNVTRADRIIVLAVSLVTIVLWILPPSLIFGDTGIVALIPIVVFFGIGILSKEDFNTLSWHLMFLLAGGNMLGLCARDSHMLDIVTVSMKDVLTSSPPYATLVAVVLLVGLITTFVSHTVAAMIMLPIIVKIGFLMPHSDGLFQVTPESMVMLSALMCSGAMAFPISSFPNVNSLLAEDERGQPYLRAKDFLFCGTAVTLFFTFCLITWMVPLTNSILH
ncbi:phosphate transporter [Strigomonas culicis]|uniref:Phosphate transporter n=1 Tax=Strigomonas culicis TaxID=28005 RepID=S9TZE8_9TRYP|nr:phosphate transporter [Strigomonas culicis]|eukprot:EPY21979.1 phosphate transporter [Strigomonas culicis]